MVEFLFLGFFSFNYLLCMYNMMLGLSFFSHSFCSFPVIVGDVLIVIVVVIFFSTVIQRQSMSCHYLRIFIVVIILIAFHYQTDNVTLNALQSTPFRKEYFK